jgi:hypothetical protein
MLLGKALARVVFGASLVASSILTNSLYGQEYAGPMGRKPSRPYAGLNLTIGESRMPGSSPGMAWLAGIEPGYKVPRNAWELIDTSVEIGTGAAQFSQSDVHVELPINLYLMAKFGYGYAIGEDVFGVIQLGAGSAFAKYDPEAGKGVSSSTLSGFIGRLGFQVQMPLSDNVEAFAGIQMNYLSFSGSDVDSFQVNLPGATIGGRYLF